MKTMKNLMIAVALFMGATTFTNAQSKTAHVDTQALVESMPEMKAAQSQLEKLQKTYDTAIKDMAKEFEAKVKQYGAEETTKTQELTNALFDRFGFQKLFRMAPRNDQTTIKKNNKRTHKKLSLKP